MSLTEVEQTADATKAGTDATQSDSPGAFKVANIVLDEQQREALVRQLDEALGPALEAHSIREERFADYLRTYKSRPEHPKKTFPWDGASNVVVPVTAIAVDSIQARLQKAIFAAKDIFEVQIKSEQAEQYEKPLRDFMDQYTRRFAQPELQTIFFDQPLYGMAYVKPVWEKKTRVAHWYDPNFEVQSEEKVEFEGVRWYVVYPGDVVRPEGYDEWKQLPWFAHRLRYTKAELKRVQDFENIDKLVGTDKERSDPHLQVVLENQDQRGRVSAKHYELFEIWGLFEVPSQTTPGELEYQEVIITYSFDAKQIVKAIYNPFFGHARHMVQISFLTQSHELDGLGVAEMTKQFQSSASASHNQQIDAGTVANAGIIATTPSANWGNNEKIYPGKRVTLEDPSKDIRVLQLGTPSPALGSAEQKAWQYAEKRTGVGAYQLGQESPIVGSQATATGTTALISEGNIRFWVSIDSMRKALEELWYITLLLIQQMKPEGLDTPAGKLMLPPGDLRDTIGLKLSVTSETINRDLEIQNLQMLIQLLNQYYGQVMQAAAIVQNPQFPPLQKAVIIKVMTSAHDLMMRLVSRFDFENVETLVPDLMRTLQEMMAAMGGANGAMAGMAPPASGPVPPAVGGGPAGPAPAAGPNGGPGGDSPAPGGGELSVQ